ncbi:MAG: polysaccharide biosynthesis tyrosine autokinase [Rhodopila sp.]|jgi:capsular exopolysaccharide synthesis family protein
MVRVRRRWGVFTIIFLFVAAMVMTARYLLVPQFTGTSTVLIERNRSPIEMRSTMADNSTAESTEVESQVEVIRSPRLLQAMLKLDDFRAAWLRACQFSKNHSPFGVITSYIGNMLQLTSTHFPADPCILDDPSAAVEAISKSFTIFQVGHSRVVSVNFQSSLPDTAALVVNSLVREYLADNIMAKSNASLATAKWLENEGLKLRQSLEQREWQIVRYRREHDLLRGQQGLLTQEALSNLILQLGAAKTRLSDATARYAEVHKAIQRGENPAEMPEVLSAGTIRELRVVEAGMTKEVAKATTEYVENHPKVLALKAQLRLLQANISAEADRIVKSLAAEMASADKGEQALELALNEAKNDAISAADADSAVQSLVRDADVDRQLYLLLASRSKELETQTRAQNPDAQLVSLAEIPVRPAFPRTIPFAGAALLLGVVFGAGAAFTRDYTDKTLRNIDDFVDNIELPILTRIPTERGLAHRGNFLTTVSNDRSGFREAIRALYAHLHLKGSLRTILVTSSAPKEGKTSVSVALAHFAAAAGQRVLLIEADLRMPVFAQIMPLKGRGLEGFFRAVSPEEASLALARNIEVPYSYLPEFHVLMAGHPAPDSTELLSSARMASLLQAMRGRYDLVVIDTPPANYLMDASVLARLTDGVIFMAKWGQSQPQLVRNGMRSITEAGGNIIGVVIGMVEYKLYPIYGNLTPIVKSNV